MPLLGGVFLNTVFNETPRRSVVLTDHPVESGANITDHVEKQSRTMSINGIITGADAAARIKKLEDFMNKGTLLQYTYRNAWSNVVIEDITTKHDKTDKRGFKFDIALKEIRLAKPTVIAKLTPQVKAQAAPVANKGLQQPTPAPPAKVYVVKPGDSLSKIGAAHKVSWQKIYEKNRGVIGSNPNLIFPGQKLVIPA